ncbi:LysR family transcriptional regulator [Streptomyces sp. NPDC048338]
MRHPSRPAAVARRAGGFSAAAAALGMTQSAVSHPVRRLRHHS